VTASRAQATAPSGAQAEKVLYDVEGGVATITLNDPETRNALSAELIEGLTFSLQRAMRMCAGSVSNPSIGNRLGVRR